MTFHPTKEKQINRSERQVKEIKRKIYITLFLNTVFPHLKDYTNKLLAHQESSEGYKINILKITKYTECIQQKDL